MGGCRCVYRKCTNSTAVSPGLHYFHFPVRDPQRCDLWIMNAQKPHFRDLDKDKLRNKVVCSLHFEENCFTNVRHDRLIHSAVPTLGFEAEIPVVETDPIHTDNFQQLDDGIMLIPIDDNNTKFAIPNTEFSGMSYTIFDDAVIPTSKIEEVIIKELENSTSVKTKEIHIKNVVKQIKTKLPELKRNPFLPKRKDISQFTVFQKQNSFPEEMQLVNTTTIERSNNSNNIPSYSVSTLNGDVSVEPTTHILPDIIQENAQHNYQNDSGVNTQTNLDQNSSHSLENISLQFKNENEYSMSVTPVGLIQNLSNKPNNTDVDNSQETVISETLYEQKPTVQIEAIDKQDVQKEEIDDQEEEMDKEYLQMIRNNAKQIKHLKQMVRKQHRFNKMVWQKKKMPHFKKKFNRLEVIETLKNHIKPSLLAILKLELLPVEEVTLSDQEEKFITDLYTENSDCYNLLRTKYNWKLPSADTIEESSDMQCD